MSHHHKGKRNIITIDEAKCDGCGLCVKSCAEGAIQLVDGKAKLISETYCDGLGACLAKCPRDAITIVEREAEAFDEKAVHEHLHKMGAGHAHPHGHKHDHGHGHDHSDGHEHHHDHDHSHGHAHADGHEHHHDHERHTEKSSRHHSHGGSGCPGSAAFLIDRSQAPAAAPAKAETSEPSVPSELSQWPVQLALVSPHAPFWSGADLLIAADCVPFAFSSFHQQLLKGKKLIIACPKLDETEPYLEKLTELFASNDVKSVTVAHMEVPCCLGLVHLVREAMRKSGKSIPLSAVKIGIKGDRLEG